MRAFVVAAVALSLGSCAGASTVKLAQNAVLIKADAAPVCGEAGAARVAERMAAIETIKSGYDRYIVLGADSSSNIQAISTGGTYRTTGTVQSFGNYGTYNGQTTYTPNAPIIVGGHSQDLQIVMFRDGEPGSQNAISARSVLGPEWQKIAKGGVMTCF